MWLVCISICAGLVLPSVAGVDKSGRVQIPATVGQVKIVRNF